MFLKTIKDIIGVYLLIFSLQLMDKNNEFRQIIIYYLHEHKKDIINSIEYRNK